MTGSSILPAAIYKNKIYFLFGKENPMEDSAKGFSDFGGGVEPGETPLETAMREGGEELSGFLGSGKDIQKYIKQSGGLHKIVFNNDYHVHIMFLDYDANLPKYYNNNHSFLWERMDKNFLNDSKLFEKIEIQWFSYDDMKKRRKDFRFFYQPFLDVLVENKQNISNFILKRYRKKNRRITKKKRGV